MQEAEKYEKTKKAFVTLDLDLAMAEFRRYMPWSATEVILDYGCGAGSTCAHYFVPQTHSSNSTIHAVDVSSQMIQYARQKYPHPRVKYHVGNIMEDDDQQLCPSVIGSSWRKLQYDKIVSMNVLHFIRDTKEVFTRLYRLLKPGGHLAFLVVARGAQFPVYRLLGEDPRFKSYFKGYGNFIPQWLRGKKDDAEYGQNFICTTAQQVGFNVKCSNLTYRVNHNQKLDTLVELYFSLTPAINDVPAELHPEVRLAIRNFLCNLTGCAPDAEFTENRHEMIIAVLEKPHGSRQA